MSRAGDPPVRNEGRRGSRIDLDEGGGYHGIAPWGKPHLQRMKAADTSSSRLAIAARSGNRSAFGEWCHEPAGIVTRV